MAMLGCSLVIYRLFISSRRKLILIESRFFLDIYNLFFFFESDAKSKIVNSLIEIFIADNHNIYAHPTFTE